MPIEINVGGVWKTVDSMEVNVGGVWKTVDNIETNISAAWKQAYSGAPEVVVAALKSITDFETTGTAFAYLGVFSDGDLYSSTTGSTPNVSYETWLDSGLNSQVWVERVIDSGSLTTDWGAGRKACTANRTLGISKASAGVKETSVTINFYDAAAGGTLLDSQSVSLQAELT